MTIEEFKERLKFIYNDLILKSEEIENNNYECTLTVGFINEFIFSTERLNMHKNEIELLFDYFFYDNPYDLSLISADIIIALAKSCHFICDADFRSIYNKEQKFESVYSEIDSSYPERIIIGRAIPKYIKLNNNLESNYMYVNYKNNSQINKFIFSLLDITQQSISLRGNEFYPNKLIEFFTFLYENQNFGPLLPANNDVLLAEKSDSEVKISYNKNNTENFSVSYLNGMKSIKIKNTNNRIMRLGINLELVDEFGVLRSFSLDIESNCVSFYYSVISDDDKIQFERYLDFDNLNEAITYSEFNDINKDNSELHIHPFNNGFEISIGSKDEEPITKYIEGSKEDIFSQILSISRIKEFLTFYIQVLMEEVPNALNTLQDYYPNLKEVLELSKNPNINEFIPDIQEITSLISVIGCDLLEYEKEILKRQKPNQE